MYSGHNFARDLGCIFRLFLAIPPPLYTFSFKLKIIDCSLQRPSKFGQAIPISP